MQYRKRRFRHWSAMAFIICGIAANCVVVPQTSAEQQARRGQGWYAGRWDSTLYAWSDPKHPRTVAVRVEVIDSRTLLPIPDVEVRLSGTYAEEHLGVHEDPGVPRVQAREFERSARTQKEGIVVLALSWQKEFPWSQGRPTVRDPNVVGDAVSGAKSWIRPVDDVEKVQQIQIRHPRYEGTEAAFDFMHLLDFGQDTSGELQDPELFQQFENAWRDEIHKPTVKFFAARFGGEFTNFNEKQSSAPAFFEKVMAKDYGTVYTEPSNLTSLSPKEYAGPYFVYLLQFALDPARLEIQVSDGDQTAEPDRAAPPERRANPHRNSDNVTGDSKAADDKRREEEAQRAAEERRKAEEAERARAERQRQLQEEADANALGIAVETLSSDRRKELGLYAGTTGVVVEYVRDGSPAKEAGLHKNEVIESIAHRSVADKDEFKDKMSSLKSGDQIAIGIWRKNSKGTWERENRIVKVK